MRTSVVIIGAGQAGLAMSRCLTDRSVDHVVLERGTVANSWRTERWDSLRLLTPNWMTRLPGHQYNGSDPHGYMNATSVAEFLDGYKASFAAPVVESTTVLSVESSSSGWRVSTTSGEWEANAVVVATGACSTPRIPGLAAELPASIRQLAPIHYRNPDQLDPGGVLVVGASASGAQIADELARSGRDVTLAVSDHVRLPRRYRGMDIHWWMDTIGLLDERHDEVDDIARARRVPSLQLVGSDDGRDLGLNELAAADVRLAGRLVGVTSTEAQFSGAFANACTSADLKQSRLLDAVDEWVASHGLSAEFGEPTRPDTTSVPPAPLAVDLSDISTVVWATGFSPSYPFLPRRVLDAKGAIRHDGGVVGEPGLYVLGLPFMRRRKSSFIDGVGRDAEDLVRMLVPSSLAR